MDFLDLFVSNEKLLEKKDKSEEHLQAIRIFLGIIVIIILLFLLGILKINFIFG